MIIRRATKVLFTISDLCAWLLILLGALSVLAYPLAQDMYAQLMKAVAPSLPVYFAVIEPLVTALGAYLLTRRKPIGLLLVLAPSVLMPFLGPWEKYLVWMLGLLLVFGAPFLLSYLDLRSTLEHQEET